VAKPIVDGIERDLQGQAKVMRLNVLSALGSHVAQKYGVRGVPTLVVLDGSDRPVEYVVGIPNRQAVVQQVQALASQGQ
jgi:thioredoxin-like negative regulator of GroEL